MRQISIFCFFIFILFSCSKKESKTPIERHRIVEYIYDTRAVDSFSPGATNINVARNIKIASKKYQDSLANQRKLEEERKIQLEIEKAKLEAQKEAEAKNAIQSQETTTEGQHTT